MIKSTTTRLGANLFLLLLPFLLQAQSLPINPPACGSDQLQQLLAASIPGYGERVAQAEQLTYEKAAKKAAGQESFTGPSYTLPLVFHIIHDGGTENIPDSRILDAVDYLNDAFANSGYFGSLGISADVPFRFCLAHQAPDGSPTNGITRTQSILTDLLVSPQDEQLKDLIRWDPTRYVNVWIVKSILSAAQGTNYAGYATLPFSHGSKFDGIVLEAQYTGSSFQRNNIVLAHEMGHYLGLYHTFQGDCLNNNCLQQGDRVCDTPPDQATFSTCGFNSCHTDADAPAPNPLSTDVNDMTENFMDYSPWNCMYRFTMGQSDRMLQLSELLRGSLLYSTGCLPPCDEGTLAGFTASATSINIADTVFFTNQSQNALTYSWYVNGQWQSSEQDFSFIPPAIGYYNILLRAYGAGTSCISTIGYGIQATCNLNGFIHSSALETAPGGSLTFQAQVDNASTYQWTVNGTAAGQNALMNWTFPTAGNYLVELSVANDYCARVLSMNILVNVYCALAAPPQLQYEIKYPTITSVEVYPNGDMLLAGNNARPFLSRIREDGSVAWSKSIWLSVFETNNMYLIHTTPDNGAITIIPESNYLMRWDSSGQLLWSSKIDSTLFLNSNNLSASNFTASPDGSFLLSGLTSGFLTWICFSADGTERWRLKTLFSIYNIGPCVAAADGGYYIILYNSFQSGLVLRLGADGTLLWRKKYRSSQGFYHIMERMVPESDGGFSFISGPYLLRCDKDGEVLWAKRFNSLTSSATVFLKKSKDKGYYYSNSKTAFAGSIVHDIQNFIKFDSLGAFRWGFQVKAFDAIGSVNSGRICHAAAESAQGPIFPLYNPILDGKIYLMRPNNNGYAGACVEQPYSLSVSSEYVTSDTVSFELQYAQTKDVPPASLSVLDFIVKPTVGCPQFPLCAENCQNQGIDDDRDGFPDCFDPQCNCLDNPNCFSLAPAPNFECRISWESPLLNINVAGLPLVANLNMWKDSMPEIVIQEAPTQVGGTSPAFFIFKGDGSDAANPFRLGAPIVGYPAGQLAIADINRNRKAEIFAIYLNRLGVFTNYGESNLLPAWGSDALFNNNESPHWRPQLADFNNDGDLEVYAGNHIMLMDTAIHRFWRVIPGDASKPHGRLAYQNAQYSTAQTMAAELLARGNCGGDPDCDGMELAAGPVMYSVDLDGWDGDPAQLTVRRDLNVLDPSPAIWSDGFTAVADINLDNIPELIVAGKRDDVYGVYAWNRNGLLKFFPYPVNTAFSGAMPCIANVVDDKLLGYAKDYPEIIAASQNRLTCFSLNAALSNPNAPYWWSMSTQDSLGLATPVAFDFNIDGLDELVFQDQAQLRLLYGGAEPLPPGVDPNRNWHVVPAPTVPGTQYPVVADCDGDGAAEIIFTSFDAGGPAEPGSLKGRLRVLKAANIPWPPARQIWNQYGYFGPHINDDLSIPIHQLEPHRPIGGKQIYNRFLGQAPVLNQQYKPFIYLPNAFITKDSSWCGQEQLYLRVKVCNDGEHALPDSLPIRFYDDNPTFTPAQHWGELQYLHQGAIAPGQCVSQVLSIPVVKGKTFYGILNDNGQNTTPFNIPNDFKFAKSAECSILDNLFTVSKNWTTPALDLGPDLESCSANAVTLNAGNAFARYRWQDGFPEAQYTAVGPGKYWVEVWDECGFRQSDTVLISLSPTGNLDLGIVPPICPGDTLTFSVSGFETVAWTPAQLVNCATCPSVRIAPTSSVLLVATGVEGDCIASDSVTILVRQAPEISSIQSAPTHDQMNNGSASVVVIGGQAPYQIVWNTIPPQSGDSIIGLSAGVYQVVVTDAAGCQTAGSATVQQVVATGSPEPAPFSLRPNPAGKQFLLEWQGRGIQLLVFNALGEKVLDRYLAQDLHSMVVDCSSWVPGTYDVVLRTGSGQWTRKVVVIR